MPVRQQNDNLFLYRGVWSESDKNSCFRFIGSSTTTLEIKTMCCRRTGIFNIFYLFCAQPFSEYVVLIRKKPRALTRLIKMFYVEKFVGCPVSCNNEMKTIILSNFWKGKKLISKKKTTHPRSRGWNIIIYFVVDSLIDYIEN